MVSPIKNTQNSRVSMSRSFIKSRNSDSESANCTWHLGIDPAIEAPKVVFFTHKHDSGWLKNPPLAHLAGSSFKKLLLGNSGEFRWIERFQPEESPHDTAKNARDVLLFGGVAIICPRTIRADGYKIQLIHLEDHPRTKRKWFFSPWWSFSSPQWGCGIPKLNGRTSWLVNRGDPITTYPSVLGSSKLSSLRRSKIHRFSGVSSLFVRFRGKLAVDETTSVTT